MGHLRHQPGQQQQAPHQPAQQVTLYGLDIETDTTVDGLDPETSPIVAIAISGGGVELVFDGPEPSILRSTDALLATLTPGLLVTWNGGRFDLPFLRRRAELVGVPIGLVLEPRRATVAPHKNWDEAVRGRWHHHDHLDGYQLFRADAGRQSGISCSLKNLARLVGLPVVEVDRAAIHRLSSTELTEYVVSDARLARQLVERRLPHALAWSDHLGPASADRVGDRSESPPLSHGNAII